MLFARVVLLIQLLALAGLGLAYFVQPHEMTNLSGMLLMAYNVYKTVSSKTPAAQPAAAAA